MGSKGILENREVKQELGREEGGGVGGHSSKAMGRRKWSSLYKSPQTGLYISSTSANVLQCYTMQAMIYT